MKADIRTDLAMEARELHAAGTGVSEQNEQCDGYAISRIRIETDEAAKALGKAKGLYVTIDAPELTYGGAELTAAVTEAAANELSAMIAGLDGTALVAGLGNRAVTPDALGPRTAEKILVTRHIKQYMADAIPHHVRSVCAVSPGVLGRYGNRNNGDDKGRGVKQQTRRNNSNRLPRLPQDGAHRLHHSALRCGASARRGRGQRKEWA